MGKSLRELLAEKQSNNTIQKSSSAGLGSGLKDEESEIVSGAPMHDIAISDSIMPTADEFNDDSQIDAFTEEKVAQMRKGLIFLADQIDNKQEVGEILKNLMMMMHNTPELAEIMQPKDIGLMVRALQENYGRVIVKKNKRSEKRKKNEESLKEIEGLLGDISINIGG